MQNNSRVYYNNQTGSIFFITPEWDSLKEHDTEKEIEQCNAEDIETVSYLEIPYGDYSKTVDYLKYNEDGSPAGRVNLETGALELQYENTEEEEKRPPTTLERVDQLEKENNDLKETILELSSMVLGGYEYDE